MCTVTFIARRNGYALGMNRDEKLKREIARPPAQYRLGGRHALFPSEPKGGTWVGVNDASASFALINWYSVPTRVAGQTVSRGDVVKSALAAASTCATEKVLRELPLARVNPFRLIAIFPHNQTVVEWRWNLHRLACLNHTWRANTWISSGFDEPGAEQTRGKSFAEALRQRSSGSLKWLRRLHRSHGPERGPYSTCMHRHDAATVSFTEIVVSGSLATMRYQPGPPCRPTSVSRTVLSFPSSRHHRLSEDESSCKRGRPTQ